MLIPIRPSVYLGGIGPYLVPTKAQEGERTAHLAECYYTHMGEFPVPWGGADTDPWATDAVDMLVWGEAEWRDDWGPTSGAISYYRELEGLGAFSATDGWGFNPIRYRELFAIIPVDGPFVGPSQVPEPRAFPPIKRTRRGSKSLPWYYAFRPHVRLMVIGRTA